MSQGDSHLSTEEDGRADRPEFLLRFALLLTALGGGAGATDAAAKGARHSRYSIPARQCPAVRAVLEEAHQTRDLPSAIKHNGSGLSPQVRAQLARLTPAEIQQTIAVNNWVGVPGPVQSGGCITTM
ncbi:MAG: hypothetical protein ACHP84_05215 [Caulobacterales bacterium]